MSDEPDLFGARGERDAALDRVAAHVGELWIGVAMRAIARLKPGWTGTGEDIRLALAKAGVPPPHHHNVWGALINRAIYTGFLIDTGVNRSMKTKKSHARSTPVYRRWE